MGVTKDMIAKLIVNPRPSDMSWGLLGAHIFPHFIRIVFPPYLGDFTVDQGLLDTYVVLILKTR